MDKAAYQSCTVRVYDVKQVAELEILFLTDTGAAVTLNVIETVPTTTTEMLQRKELNT